MDFSFFFKNVFYVISVVEQPKPEDDDTDVDEPSTTLTSIGDDAEKMDVGGETKPQDEPPANAVHAGDAENGLKEKPGKAETTEDVAKKVVDGGNCKDSEAEVKTGDGEKPGDSLKVKDKTSDEDGEAKKEAVVIEEEEEEDPEPEDEDIEDRDDGGEDPSEIEIEKFNMPLEQALLSGKYFCLRVAINYTCRDS